MRASQGARERAKYPAASQRAPNTRGKSAGLTHASRANTGIEHASATPPTRTTTRVISPGGVSDRRGRYTCDSAPAMRATGACRASHAMLNWPSEATEYVAMSIGIALVRTASTTTLGTPTRAILR